MRFNAILGPKIQYPKEENSPPYQIHWRHPLEYPRSLRWGFNPGGMVGKNTKVFPRLTYEFLSTLERHSSSRGHAYSYITFNAFNYTYSMTYPQIAEAFGWELSTEEYQTPSKGAYVLFGLTWLVAYLKLGLATKLVDTGTLPCDMYFSFSPWPSLVKASLPKYGSSSLGIYMP